MNKPLSIDELKSLEVGDWVWIVDNEIPQYTGYYKIDLFAISHLHIVQGLGKTVIPFSTYGEQWLAYKNKEQAECKGEIVELPCHWGDTVYFIDHRWGKDRFEWVDVKSTKFDWEAMRDWNDLFFATRKEAERRLAELKGE